MRGGELFDEATLGFVELGGDQHIDVGDEVAALVLVADVRDAQSLKRHSVLSLAAGRDGHGLLTIERINGQIVAKHGPAHRHLNPAVQVVAIAGELLIRLDADIDVQVAGSAAALTHFALVGQPQTRVVVDAGGHGNAHGTRGAHTAVAHAAGARVLDDGTVALATFTGGGGHHLAEHGAHDLLHESLSVAVGAGDRLCAALGTGATALLAQGERIDLDMRGAAEHRRLQIDGRRGQGIAAGLGTRHRAL